MRRLILGTAGHIDHGKTALVRALTGIDTDRLPEEKRRGITIDLGFASLRLGDDTELGIVDVPGHEAFVRNMLAGATGMDLALLVVAADEGVMPQTREHLAILELLGVRNLVVALTKADLADAEWRDLVIDDVRRLLSSGPFAAADVVAVSARTGDGLDALVEALTSASRTSPPRSERDLFRLPIDRVFTVRGSGTVVTGTVWSGATARDAQLRLLPADRAVRIRALQAHGEERQRVTAGQRAALNLASVDRAEVSRGDALLEGEGWVAARVLTTSVRALEGGTPLTRGRRVRFHLGTAETMGRVVPFDGPIEPGATAWAQLRLERPVVARAGDRFVLRSYSPVATIAGGIIAEPVAPKRKRPSSGTRENLDRLTAVDPRIAIEAATLLAGWSGVAPSRLAILTPHSPEGVRDVLDAGVARTRQIGQTVFHEDPLEEAARRVREAVDAHHASRPLSPGASREELRQLAPGRNAALVERVLDDLIAAGILESDASLVRRAGFAPRLDPGQRQTADRLLGLFAEAGLMAPSAAELPAELAGRSDTEDILRYLERTGRLTSIGAGRFLEPDTLDRAVRLVRGRLAGRTDLGPGDFRDLFGGLSRKYLIPLLEHFDRTGVTRRSGDQRQVEPEAAL